MEIDFYLQNIVNANQILDTEVLEVFKPLMTDTVVFHERIFFLSQRSTWFSVFSSRYIRRK